MQVLLTRLKKIGEVMDKETSSNHDVLVGYLCVCMQGKRFCQTFILLGLEGLRKEIVAARVAGQYFKTIQEGSEMYLSGTVTLSLFYRNAGNTCLVGLNRIIHV